MIRKQLTDDAVNALPAKRKRYVVYDSIERALGVRVSPKGKKTFIVVGRFNGNKHPTRRKLAGKLTVRIGVTHWPPSASKRDPLLKPSVAPLRSATPDLSSGRRT